jgi:GNAT superfamily N-acetyltransferase
MFLLAGKKAPCDSVNDNVEVVEVRPAVPGDIPACVVVVRSLPEWFTPDVADEVARDATKHQTWVVTEAHGLLGFAIVVRRSIEAAEILHAAVHADRRGAGVGTQLVEQVLAELAHDGVALVEVKTLDASADYLPYVATRTFWERRGFVQVDSIDPLPGWQAGNPAAVYIAALRTTR